MRHNIELYKQQQKDWDTNKRKEGDRVFGTKCAICGREPKYPERFRNPLHRKDGQDHPDCNTAAIALKNPDEWVRLCVYCHIGVHFCMVNFYWNWETIFNHLKTSL